MTGREDGWRPAHSSIYRYPDDFHRESFSLRGLGWKLIDRPAGWSGGSLGGWSEATRELYDLTEDPREVHDLYATSPEILEHLIPELQSQQEARRRTDIQLSPEQRARLRSLGYIR